MATETLDTVTLCRLRHARMLQSGSCHARQIFVYIWAMRYLTAAAQGRGASAGGLWRCVQICQIPRECQGPGAALRSPRVHLMLANRLQHDGLCCQGLHIAAPAVATCQKNSSQFDCAPAVGHVLYALELQLNWHVAWVFWCWATECFGPSMLTSLVHVCNASLLAAVLVNLRMLSSCHVCSVHHEAPLFCLQCFTWLCSELDAIQDFHARLDAALRGVFAGNVFDLGSPATSAAYESGEVLC